MDSRTNEQASKQQARKQTCSVAWIRFFFFFFLTTRGAYVRAPLVFGIEAATVATGNNDDRQELVHYRNVLLLLHRSTKQTSRGKTNKTWTQRASTVFIFTVNHIMMCVGGGTVLFKISVLFDKTLVNRTTTVDTYECIY
jgi:hypothetical protein